MTLRLLALLFCLAALPALARPHGSSGPTQSCPDKCEKTKDECVSVCQEYAGAKGGGMCKKACDEGAKKCQERCKKKKH